MNRSEEDQIELDRQQSIQAEEEEIDQIFLSQNPNRNNNIDQNMNFIDQKLQSGYNKCQIKNEKCRQIFQILSNEFQIDLEKLFQITISQNKDTDIAKLIEDTAKRNNNQQTFIKQLYGSLFFNNWKTYNEGILIESLEEKDIGISGSASLWALQNLQIQEELYGKNQLQKFQNKLNWIPNDLDIFCFSRFKINLPIDYLQENGYYIDSHERYINRKIMKDMLVVDKEYEENLIEQEVDFLDENENENGRYEDRRNEKYLLYQRTNKQKSGFSRWRFSVFNFVNLEIGRKIQFVVKEDSFLNFDMIQLENFFTLQKAIIKPVYKILEINYKQLAKVNPQRLQKYMDRGYCTLPNKLVKYTIMRCVLLKRRMQKGKFNEKRINDYISEILNDFFVVNYINKLKKILQKYSFQEMIFKLSLFLDERKSLPLQYYKLQQCKCVGSTEGKSISYQNVKKEDVQFQRLEYIEGIEDRSEFKIISKDYWARIENKDEEFEKIFPFVCQYWGIDVIQMMYDIQNKFKIENSDKIDEKNIPFPLKLLFFMMI